MDDYFRTWWTFLPHSVDECFALVDDSKGYIQQKRLKEYIECVALNQQPVDMLKFQINLPK